MNASRYVTFERPLTSEAWIVGNIAPSGPALFRREHRLLPIYWPAGPQTVKTNQLGDKPNQSQQA
jgi:hypothetical protein